MSCLLVVCDGSCVTKSEHCTTSDSAFAQVIENLVGIFNGEDCIARWTQLQHTKLRNHIIILL